MQAVESPVSTWLKLQAKRMLEALKDRRDRRGTDRHTHTKKLVYKHMSYWNTKIYSMV